MEWQFKAICTFYRERATICSSLNSPFKKIKLMVKLYFSLSFNKTPPPKCCGRKKPIKVLVLFTFLEIDYPVHFFRCQEWINGSVDGRWAFCKYLERKSLIFDLHLSYPLQPTSPGWLCFTLKILRKRTADSQFAPFPLIHTPPHTHEYIYRHVCVTQSLKLIEECK